MNKTKLAENISLCVASLFSFVMSLVYFIKSYYRETDEWGYTDISFSKDYVIALVVSLLVLAFAVYQLVAQVKNQEVSKNAGSVVALTSVSLVSFYNLGVFFKALFKAVAKANDKKAPLSDYFSYGDYKAYLYIGILLLILIVFYVFKLLNAKKAK